MSEEVREAEEPEQLLDASMEPRFNERGRQDLGDVGSTVASFNGASLQ